MSTERYKAELRRLDSLVARLRAKVKRLEQELDRALAEKHTSPTKPMKISKTDGLDFFEAYTGLQIKRMKL